MKLIKLHLLIATLLMLGTNVFSNSAVNIIPKPQKTTTLSGSFVFDKKTRIIYKDAKLEQTARTLQASIKNTYGINTLITLTSKQTNNSILLELVEGLDDEAYILDVQIQKITCKASTEAGIFYALQSLLQIMTIQQNKISAICVLIEDKPLYPWRGYMLDESRHFFGKETVKQYLDIMASLKLNRFHWHLTDEPAWRIEIKKYPKLTEIGAIGTWDDSKAPPAFYTQEDIKEIVAYAAERHIMVIPEIDMPGHANAATRAYPEVSGGGKARWDGFTFHPAKEYTYEFINNILTEIAALFPAPYIHIGADEVHYGNQSWHTDTIIQSFIKKNYLIDEVGMEHYFVRRVCEMVNAKGKKMIGWDEIINAGVTPKKAVVMWWRHDKPQILSQSLEKGFDIIMTPRIPAYFDFVQDSTHKIGRRWGGYFNELQTVYSFPENMKDLIGRKDKQILGIQANVFTERIADKKRLDFMIFPRLLAMAENAWTPNNNKHYTNFEERVKIYMLYLDRLGVKYYNPFNKEATPEPWGPDKADIIKEG